MITPLIEEQFKIKSPLIFKGVNNFCVSGHSLIFCLDYLT